MNKLLPIALLLVFTSCSTLMGTTRQNLNISYKLHEEMTKNEVESIAFPKICNTILV